MELLEVVGEVRVLGDFLVHGNLSEVQVLSRYCIWSLGGVESLLCPWEGVLERLGFLDFIGGMYR